MTDAVEYDAFGNEIARVGTTPTEHLYRGEQFDPNLGFYYLRARYYDPSVGRFATMDGFAGYSMDPGSLHKYLYTHADPVNYFDPSGHESLISISTAVNIIAVGSMAIHAGFRIAEGDYQGAAYEVARDGVFWALGAGVGKLIAPFGKAVISLFSRQFMVPLEVGLARSGTVLTRNMEAVMARAGFPKPAGWQAHHIVGEAYPAGQEAMRILRNLKIDVNSPLNGVFLPGCGAKGSTGIAGLAVHCGKHVEEYEKYVLEQLESVGGLSASESAVVNVLSRIRHELMHEELFLNVRGNL
jgi:RHS repeat-associated protein